MESVGPWGADTGPPLLNTACEVSWAPEPRCFPQPSSGKVAQALLCLRFPAFSRSRASGQGGQKQEDFQGTSQALCFYLPWATRLPLSRLSNWETNHDWLKLLSNFALYLDLIFWRSQNPNFSLFFFFLYCSVPHGLVAWIEKGSRNNKCDAPKSEDWSPIIIYKNMCPVTPIAVLILILLFHK